MQEGSHILVVDDQAGVRRLLYEVFSDDGHRVEMAAGGLEALKKVAVQPPDIVLMDIKMPGVNGLETLQELRKNWPTLMVVMMTAYGELDVLSEAKSMGVKHYIIKPFDLDEVRYLVRGLLSDIKTEESKIKGIG